MFCAGARWGASQGRKSRCISGFKEVRRFTRLSFGMGEAVHMHGHGAPIPAAAGKGIPKGLAPLAPAAQARGAGAAPLTLSEQDVT
ncbi:hypothetical protein D7X33_20615 [Butyricicoccus sp. 1XD8-22]|nr:hypothetical protein D7X33_20615 [Butyricicoccus sp. 1XD8-22]